MYLQTEQNDCSFLQIYPIDIDVKVEQDMDFITKPPNLDYITNGWYLVYIMGAHCYSIRSNLKKMGPLQFAFKSV